MSLQDNQVHFFEKLSSELGFSHTTPSTQETISCVSSSLPTFLQYKSASSEETLEGSFFLEKSFLVYYQAETMELPRVILDLSYARLHQFFECSQEPTALKISLDKNENSHEIVFHDKTEYDAWMVKLRQICILTDFEKKYRMVEFIKIGNFYECLLQTKAGGSHYCARLFEKKYLTSSENSLAKVRLMNEIEILRALRKQSALTLQEVQETEDSIYLVTDFAHNLTLKKKIKAVSTSFPETETQTIMYQLLKILAEMASKRIVHRNLKPSNILMEDKLNIRIINFGMATFINSPKANAGVCGTPGFMAPEILNSQPEDRVYDDKIDVFSAGCIFFRMLFGYSLFKGSKTSEISASNKNFKYDELIKLVMEKQNDSKSLSMKLGLHLLLKLLHNDPKQRISAKEALCDAYFKPQESFHSNKLSRGENEIDSSPKISLTISSQNSPKRVSFDLSPNESSKKSPMVSSNNSSKRVSFNLSPNGSSSLKKSFSEAVNDLENSTPCSSNSSLRKPSEDDPRQRAPRSCFKSYSRYSRFKSVEEKKFSVPAKRLSATNSGGTLMLQKTTTLAGQNKEDSYNIHESHSLSSPKNYPVASPEIKKHPNKRRENFFLYV